MIPKDNLNVVAFKTPDQAFALQKLLLDLQGERLFQLTDAVVVVRHADGSVKLHQSLGQAVPGYASAGSIVGLILGGILGAPWLGSAVAAGVGACVGAARDFGVDDAFAKQLGETLQPGTAALVLLGSQLLLDEFTQHAGDLLKDCTLLQTSVDPQRRAEIEKSLAKHAPGGIVARDLPS